MLSIALTKSVFLGLNKQSLKPSKRLGYSLFPSVRRLSNEMLRSQAEHHAGMRFLLLLADTCGERPAILTSRTATFSALRTPSAAQSAAAVPHSYSTTPPVEEAPPQAND